MIEDRAPGRLQRVKEAASVSSRFWRGFGHKGPRGPRDGPPALVIPGFIASDRTTMELRRALAEAGFRVHPWRHGINWGARADTLDQLKRAVDLCGADQPMLIVGWSLGGLYAREIARAEPERVRAVVTLGSPVWGDRRCARTASTRWYIAAGADAGHLVAARRDRRSALGARDRGYMHQGGGSQFDPHGLCRVEEGDAAGGGRDRALSGGKWIGHGGGRLGGSKQHSGMDRCCFGNEYNAFLMA
jgi:pimeloyl-ACP methyl ester carboxylesterase